MIRPGDRVIPNSGGAVMTVINTISLGDGSFMVDCRWIDMFGDWWSQRFPCDCLEKIDHRRAKQMTEQYSIIRCDRAGVFAGYIKSRTGSEATLTNVRRLWYWDGAASLSQMAVDGVSKPRNCKFTVTVPEMTILGVNEIIPCTEKAEASIKGVAEWRV